MASKMLIIISIVAALAFTPTLGMADSFGLSGASVAGHMHDDQGSTGAVKFTLKWHDVTNVPGLSFGMDSFDLRGLVGGTSVNQAQADTALGITFTGNSVDVAFWLDSGKNINHYPDPSALGTPTGYIRLTSITFSKVDNGKKTSSDLLTLSGEIIGMEAAQAGLTNGMGFELIATSKNKSAENQFAAKYSSWAGGESQGSGDVPFGTSLTTTAATPEPGTMLLLGSSLGLMGFLRRRRKEEKLAA